MDGVSTLKFKIVNQKITDGEQYRKNYPVGISTMRETLLIEAALILYEGLKPQCLNLSLMHKARLPVGKDKKRLHGILQELLSWLN
jgi:hypothetical protein